MPLASDIAVRPARVDQTNVVLSILLQAQQWLTDRGIPLWKADELRPEHVQREVAAGMFWLALINQQPVGCVRFQLEDPLFWPDVPPAESAFVHRLAVRRQFAGQGVSTALLEWARHRAAALQRQWLRLDTAADRKALRTLYERFGFVFHSERDAGPYRVARYQIAVSGSGPHHANHARSVTFDYLKSTPVIDFEDPAIQDLARLLAVEGDDAQTAANCFHWVRDQVMHSVDAQRGPVTCRASEVLAHRVGYCYAKSHLLVALLRACGIPAGFCYQRLSLNDSGPPYSLHGFNAVLLRAHGWYRCDPRGNRPGVNARFTPPVEQLAFPLASAGEVEFQEVLTDPLPEVTAALQCGRDWRELLASLPDVLPEQWHTRGLSARRRVR